jgi:hypothetical protein
MSPAGPQQRLHAGYLTAEAGPGQEIEAHIFTCLRSYIALSAHLEQRTAIEQVKGTQFCEPP